MEEKKGARLISFVLALALFSVLSAPVKAQNSARLFFSPDSGSHAVGKNFAVGVYVGSPEQAMNAVSVSISFPPDKMEVTGISRSGTIINLWVQEPSFSNSIGTVNFEGIVLNPGWQGNSGRLITINFKVKRAGNAALLFSAGAVLANDGFGTNILGRLGSATFAFGPQAPEATTPAAALGTPGAPPVSSPTHPDPTKWYANNDPTFNWPLPREITAVNVLADKDPAKDPGTRSDGLFSTYAYQDVDEGSWYFHLRLRNAAGWGGIAHFRFQIDTEKPARFDIKEAPRADLTEPKVKFTFEAEDRTSGIDYYEVQIDDGAAQVIKDGASRVYETPILESGKHILLAKAFDKAGNFLATSAEFTIEAIAPPTFTEYPRELKSNEILIAKGTTYPNAWVTIWLQKENEAAKSFTIKSDASGNFTFIADRKLQEGVYQLWALVTDARGAKSRPTEKLTIAVSEPPFLKLGAQAIAALAVIIPLIALLILLIYVLKKGWHKYIMLRRRLRKELNQAEKLTHASFDMLREDVREQIKVLEKVKSKRELTEEEDRIIKQLKKDLDKAEKVIRKEIEGIEKEVK